MPAASPANIRSTKQLIRDGLEQPPEVAAALVAAYRFISQPRVAARPKADGPAVLTYETYRYDALTAQLRDAIAKAGGSL